MVTISNPYLVKSSSSSKSQLFPSKLVRSNLRTKKNISRIRNGDRSSHHHNSNEPIGQDVSTLSLPLTKDGSTELFTLSSILPPAAPINTAERIQVTPFTGPKEKKNTVAITKNKKRKMVSAAASFKAHLRKEISQLKKQKKNKKCEQELLERKHALKEKKEVAQKQLEERQAKALDRQQRKEHKRLEKERKQNILKEKLTRDLEQRQIEEAQRLERKREMEEKREANKLKKREEREEKKRLEREEKKKEMEYILAQVRARQLKQEQHQMLRINNIPSTHNNFSPTNCPQPFLSNVCGNPVTCNGHGIFLPPSTTPGLGPYAPSSVFTPSINRTPPLSSESALIQNSHIFQSNSRNTNVTTANDYDARTVSGYSLYTPTKHHQYQYNLYQNFNHSQWNQYQNPCTYLPIGYFPAWYNPTTINYIPSSLNSPSASIMSASKFSGTMHGKNCNEEKKKITQKEMVLDKDPLSHDVYSKTHCLLPFKIIIWKGEEQNFGVDIRYDTRGTLVERRGDELKHNNTPRFENTKGRASTIIGSQTNCKNNSLSSSQIDSCQNFTTKQHSAVDAKGIIHSSAETTKSNACTEMVTGHTGKDMKEEKKENTKDKLQQKTKRKRLLVGVMTVVGATEQNKRAGNSVPKHKLLQGGDIILEIDGRSVGNLSFQNALKLFAGYGKEKKIFNTVASLENGSIAETPKLSDSKIRKLDKIECTITVAREKKVIKILERLAALTTPPDDAMPKEKKVTREKPESKGQVDKDAGLMKDVKCKPEKEDVLFVIDERTHKILSGEFTSTELDALIMGVRRFLFEKKNIPGEHDLSEESFYKILRYQSFKKALFRRNARTIMNKWYHATHLIDKMLIERAHQKWKAAWIDENKSTTTDAAFAYMSDSHKNMLRSSPRPSQGCRCGSMSHSHVNHPDCFLYKNLKKFETSIKYKKALDQVVRKFELNMRTYDDLNSIGTAHMKRLKNRQEEDRDLNIEALFVSEMERIQVHKLQSAIFAPRHLTTLVLSTIASLSEITKEECIYKISETASDADCETDYQKDTEVFASFSDNRSQSSNDVIDANGNHSPRKRQGNLTPNSFYLAHMIHHISATWGAVFRDLVHADYAWAEMCKYDNSTKNEMESMYFKNPRQPGQFPFEMLHLMLDKPTIERLKMNQSDPNFDRPKRIEDELLLSHFMSDRKTGLMKEITSIVNTSLAQITKDGFIVLSDGWEANVPHFILNDMVDNGWDRGRDTENKFCLHGSLRENLSKTWVRLSNGWGHRCTPCKMVYSDLEYEEKKAVFEEKFEERMNEIDGIAQFGI